MAHESSLPRGPRLHAGSVPTVTGPTQQSSAINYIRRKTAGAFRRAAARIALPAPELPKPPLVATKAPATTARYREVAKKSEDDRLVPPWPLEIGPGRLGQLTDDFQARQVALRDALEPEDCEWYHEVELSDGARIGGAWDLIGNETAYLGGVDLDGKRVLEMGPASGYLTFYMEQCGAEVVAFDAGLDAGIDIVGAGDFASHMGQFMRYVGQVQNSWWWLKRYHGAAAKAVYGSIYDLPADIGRFDTTLFAAILLHLRDPYCALQQASRVTDGQIIVTDVVPPGLTDWSEEKFVFHPVEGNRNSWWQLSPALIQHMLRTLDLPNQTITRHMQYTRPWHDMTQSMVPVEFYTIVARH
jgi:SAM-dependent methyltransferase